MAALTETRRKFHRESPAARREALIAAALDLVAEGGLEAATVRAIAERAEVTQGLIRHYFETKEQLLAAAFARHMAGLTAGTRAGAEGAGSAADRLARFVAAGLRPPVASPRGVAIWAGFLPLVRRDAAMRRTHAETYAEFRDHLEGLIAAALAEAGRPAPPERLRSLAIAANAVIDGLWLEGSLLPESFAEDEPARLGLEAVAALTGLPLTEGPRP
jgi:AcrR family transcriptional regulator